MGAAKLVSVSSIRLPSYIVTVLGLVGGAPARGLGGRHSASAARTSRLVVVRRVETASQTRLSEPSLLLKYF